MAQVTPIQPTPGHRTPIAARPASARPPAPARPADLPATEQQPPPATDTKPKETSKHYNRVVTDLKNIGVDFRINDLNEALEVKWRGGPWQLMDDTTEALIRTELREIGYGIKGGKKANRTAVTEAWITLGHNQRYNPIKTYLDSIRHLYQPNTPAGSASPQPYMIGQIASKLTNPDGYAWVWLHRWTVGAIAKLYMQERNPMLVFAGEQEIGKSTFIRWLCPTTLREYYREGPIKPDNKDDRLKLADTFIQEVSELGSTTRRADVDALKDYITKKEIMERPPYGKRPIKKPAVCSFFGSVNFDGAGFLNDTTGSTRFLVCDITGIDFSYSELNINLIWSEALWFYEHIPRSWELTPEEKAARAEINRKYQLVQPLEDVVFQYLELTHNPKDFMTTYDIRLYLSPHYRYSSETSFDMELARVLSSMGLERQRGSYNPAAPTGTRHPNGYRGLKRKAVDMVGDIQP